MISYCLNCHNQLSDKREGAKFCSQECKNKHSYKLRTGQLKGTEGVKKHEDKKDDSLPNSLRGVIKSGANSENKTDQLKTSFENLSIDSEAFKELLGETSFNVDNKLEQNFEYLNEEDQQEETTEPEEIKNTPPETILPEKYLTKETKVENGLYVVYKNFLNEYGKSKQDLEQEFKKLQAELKFQEERNGNGFVKAGVLTGLALSLPKSPKDKEQKEGDMTLRDKEGNIIDKSKKNKWKKKYPFKEESPSIWEKLAEAVVKVGLCAGAGKLIQLGTEGWREKDKLKKIAVIKNKMAALDQEYRKLNEAINSTNHFLSSTPQYKIKTEQLLNPEYEKALSGLSNKEPNEPQKPKKDFKPSKPMKFKSNKIIKATDLANIDYDALEFTGLWKEFFGEPSLNFKLLVHGNSGEGKSTFCIWFARYLAENFGRVLYVCGEEGVSKTFKDKLIYCKAEVENFYILDVRTGDEFMKEVGVNEFHFIVLDSLHDMDINAKKLKVLFAKYQNTAFICIDQNNKKGELLGANEKKHLQDMVVNVMNYVAETTKNRFRLKGQFFETKDFTGS